MGLSLLVGISMASCHKTKPEDEVKSYAKYFVEKVNANQVDSLVATYPDIAKADSLISINSDAIIVTDGDMAREYEVTLAKGVTLTVNRADDGTITVTESKGLFAFPADKTEIAKKTGLWEADLSDATVADRMKDEDFFNYLNKKANTSQIITISKGSRGYILTNTTSQPISAGDYRIQVRTEEPTYIPGTSAIDEWVKKISYEPGKNIEPNGTAQYYGTYEVYSYMMGQTTNEKEVTGIKWNLTPEQLKERFASYNGNEYKEYLKTKGNTVSDAPLASVLKVSKVEDAGHLNSQAGNSYHPKNLFDGNLATTWAVKASDDFDMELPLQGPWITLEKPSKIEGIEIANGYGKNKSSFLNNTRAAWIRIYRHHPEYDGEMAEGEMEGEIAREDLIYEGPLKDTMDFQRLPVSKGYNNNKPTRYIGIQFKNPNTGNGYYRGNKWNDLCISEIRILGK